MNTLSSLIKSTGRIQVSSPDIYDGRKAIISDESTTSTYNTHINYFSEFNSQDWDHLYFYDLGTYTDFLKGIAYVASKINEEFGTGAYTFETILNEIGTSNFSEIYIITKVSNKSNFDYYELYVEFDTNSCGGTFESIYDSGSHTDDYFLFTSDDRIGKCLFNNSVFKLYLPYAGGEETCDLIGNFVPTHEYFYNMIPSIL